MLEQLTSGLEQGLKAPDHQKGLKLQTRTKMTEKITSRAHNPLNLTEHLGLAKLRVRSQVTLVTGHWYPGDRSLVPR